MKAQAKSENGILALGATRVPFTLTRSKKRKRTIAFRMERDASLRVMAPAHASLNSVTRILQDRAAWIARELDHLKHAEPDCDFSDSAVFSYLGHRCVLRVTQGGGVPSCRLSPHRFHIHVPVATGDNLREEVRLELSLWLKKRARTVLKKRLDLWAGHMGLSYKRMTIADAAQRWGSCSADNIIRLNWRLMLAPLAVIDYVVLHELAHIKHKNHGPRFWGCVARYMPDWQARRKKLRHLERALMI